MAESQHFFRGAMGGPGRTVALLVSTQNRINFAPRLVFFYILVVCCGSTWTFLRLLSGLGDLRLSKGPSGLCLRRLLECVLSFYLGGTTCDYFALNGTPFGPPSFHVMYYLVIRLTS